MGVSLQRAERAVKHAHRGDLQAFIDSLPTATLESWGITDEDDDGYIAAYIAQMMQQAETGTARQQFAPVAVRSVQRFHRHLGAEPYFLDPEEVEHLIKTGESAVVDFMEVRVTVDRKFSWSSKDIAVAACGFANTVMGGVLLCGVKDRPREVTGIPPDCMDDFEHHVSQALRTCASPPIRHALSSVQVRDSAGSPAWVVAVDIPPGMHLTEAGGAVYQRHGDETVEKLGVALQDLRQGWSTVCGLLDAGDVAAVPGAALSRFLDKTKLERLGLASLADDPNMPQQMCSMRLAARYDDQVVLTVAGLLLLSKVENWQRALGCPSYGVQIQVFNNDDPPGSLLSADIRSAVEITGDALFQVDRTVEHVMALTTEAYQKRVIKDADGRMLVRGFENPLYPAKAVQELVVNAVVHRAYRQNAGKIVVKIRHRSLEIRVPGDFLPGVTAANIGTVASCSLPRNPVLASFVHDMQRINQPVRIFEGHGLGVRRAREAIEAAGGTLSYRSGPAGAVTVVVTAAPMPACGPLAPDA